MYRLTFCLSQQVVLNFDSLKQETEDWAKEVERQIKLGQSKFDQHKAPHIQ